VRLLVRRGAILAAASAATLALLAQGAAVTDASWTDPEWDFAEVGAVDCTDADGNFLTRGAGQALSGSLLGVDLTTVAEASGVEVTNNGQRALPSPDGASPAPEDPAYADPLSAGLLNNALGFDLTSYLQLPLDNSMGVLGQYGEAQSDGDARGASGYITETGGIATQPGSGYPELATLKLSSLLGALNHDLGDLLPDIADAELQVGAVTGRASVEGCEYFWGSPEAAVNREYLATDLLLRTKTPTLSALTGSLDDVIGELEDTVNGLADDQGVLDSLLGAVTGLLDGLISGVLGLGSVEASLTASVDTSALRDLIHPPEPLTDSGGVLAIDIENDTITVDTVALLQAAYPGQYSNGLNGLPPNTNLLADAQITNTLVQVLSDVLGDWLDQVSGVLADTIDGVQVNADVVLSLKVDAGLLGIVDIGAVTATVSGSLGDLLKGDVTANVSTDLNLGLLGALLKPVVEGLVNTLVGGLVNELGATVGGVVEGVLGPLRELPSTVTGLVEPVVTALSGLYEGLFLDGVVAVNINAQNDPFTGSAASSDWSTIPDGQYDVAAIRLGVLDSLGASNVALYLGRGSVGTVCSAASASSCDGY